MIFMMGERDVTEEGSEPSAQVGRDFRPAAVTCVDAWPILDGALV
jgi:hypothetical protein